MDLVASFRSFTFARRAVLFAGVALLLGMANAATVTYTVDPATGRLSKATYPDGSYVTYGYDGRGNRTSAILTPAPDTTAPSAPGTLTFSAITATSATATWVAATDNIGVASYEYSRNGGSTWTNVGNVLSTSITGLTGSTSYTVLVRAKDAANNIGGTSSNSFTTSDTTAPSAPGTLSFSAITATSATATWVAATDNVAVTSYEWSRNGGSTWTNVGNVLTTSITGLTGSTTYTVLVRAKDAANNIGANRSNSFTTSDTTAPSAPGTLTFSAITATSATATWVAATDNVGVTSYEWSRNGGSTWTNVGNVLTTSITGLTGSTTYTVLVRAKDAANNIGANRSNSFTTSDTTAPSAPGTLTFSAITATSATATWVAATDNVGVTSYEWSRNGGSTWTNVGNVLTTSITGLTGSTTYTVLVRAKDAANNIGANRSNSFTTSDTTAPSAPGTLTFSAITTTSATATWVAATDNIAVTSYEWSRNGGSTWTSVGTSLTASITGLSPSTAYTVLVRAKDAANNIGPNRSGTFTTTAAADSTAPSAPGTPTFGSITGTTATASWAAATDNVGVASYEWSRNGGSTWTNVGNVLTASLTGLTNGTSYTFQVRARDAANNVGTASSNSFSTLDTAAPGLPGTPTFSSIGSTSAVASWTAASDNVGVTGYQISLTAGASWSAASSGVTLSGLTSGASYTLQVRARDAAGNWGNPSSASFTTLDAIAPGVPGTPAFTSITGSSAVVTFSAATDNVGVAGYEYSLNGGGWTGGSSGMTLSGLTNGTSYSFQVRAYDAAGNRGTPSSGSFTTSDTAPPSVPGTPTFSSIGSTSAVASWTAASDNVGVTGYQISLTAGASWSDASSGVTLSGLTSGVTYTLYVRARDAAGNWGSSSSASFTTLDTIAPGAPGAPSFSSVSASSAVVSWSAATDNVGVAGYEYSLNGGAWTGGSSGMTLSGLANATSYSVQVRAYDAAGNRGTPSSGSFTTVDNVAPSAPGTPSFSSITGSSAVVSFAASSDNVGVAGYEYMLGGGGWNVATSGMTVSGLTSGTTYSFQVRAFDAAGNRSNLSLNSFTTLDTAAPSAPGTPTFSSVGPTSAVVSFGAASDNVGVAGYEYSLNGGAWSGASSGMTLSGLSTGATYTVQVRAYDAAGNRGNAASNSFTTVDNIAPSAPGTPSFSSIGSTTAVASWSAASDNLAVTSYEYSINGGSSWTNVGNTTSAAVSGLSTAATTTVQIRARDAAGNAGSASSASVTTIAQITIANRTVATTVPGFNGSSAIYQLTTAGDIMVTQPSSSTAIDGGDWLSPKSGMGNFQVMGTLVSTAACSSATMNTWLNLTSNQTWAVGRGGPSGTTACTFDIQIRHSSNPSVILGTARIVISATN